MELSFMGWYFNTVLTLFSTASTLFAPSARAYPTPVDFDGSLLRWNVASSEEPITYRAISDDDLVLSLFAAAVDDAADLWSDIPSSYFRFTPAEGDSAQVTVNLQSSLDGSPFSSGYAVFDAIDGEGSPVHCSIFVGVDPAYSYTSIAKTILHEMGHCVGLGHSLIGEAIMSYRLDQNAFALDIDDEAAMTRLYPTDGSEPQLPPGCSVGPINAASHGTLLLLALSLPALARLLRVGRWSTWSRSQRFDKSD